MALVASTTILPAQSREARAIAASAVNGVANITTVAASAGSPKGARAAGNALGSNPIAIVIPCHRVLGKGWLGGYSGSGGLETKKALLALEGALG